MSFVEGFVIPVKTADRDKYKAFAETWAPFFKEYGVTRIVENWGVDVPDGEVTSFLKAVKLEPGETVVFSWMVWPSKEFRDTAWEKIHADPRMANPPGDMPFDGKRMIMGGFETIMEA